MATMSSPAVGEKRKQPDEQPFCMFEIRVVMENIVATDPILAPAIECSTMVKTFDVVKAKQPLTRRQSILGEELCAPIFLLQEASHKARR